MPGSILVVTFDTSTGIRTGRLVGSALLEDNAVVSGKLGSGIIGPIHFAPFSSGMVVIGQDAGVIPVYGYPPAGVPGDESITSAKLASGAVIGDRVADVGIFSGKIAVGTIGGDRLLNAIITSAKLASGAVGGVLLQDAGVLSGKLAAAVVGGDRLWDFGLVSGKYASGSITEQALMSGISIDISEISQEPGYRAGELISSYFCVYVAPISGNYVKIATCLSGGMPAIGIAAANIASGDLGVINYGGRAAADPSVVSGQYGRQVFVGSGGLLGMAPPSTSGYCQQIMGAVKDDGKVFLFPEPGYIEIA